MDLTPTTEQSELIRWAEEVVAEQFSLDRFLGLKEPVAEPGLEKLAELGWFALALPEAAGGTGLSVIEETLLMKVAGALLPGPTLLANTLAAHLATADGDSALARRFATLESRATLAFPVTGGVRTEGPQEVYALDRQDDSTHLVLFGTQGIALHPMDEAGSPVRHGIDDSVATTRLSLQSPAPNEGDGPIWIRAQLLTAALLVGAGEGALAMAVEYAKMREQFGKPIGSFQAIKHKCADIALQLAAARSQMIFAAVSLKEGTADAAFQVRAARTLAGNAGTTAAYGNVQIHGGIGFTSECHAQRFVKRTVLLNMVGGDARQHRSALLSGPPDLHEAA